jgi:hypothetical protein
VLQDIHTSDDIPQSRLSIRTHPAGIYFDMSRMKSSGTRAEEEVGGGGEEKTKADCVDEGEGSFSTDLSRY